MPWLRKVSSSVVTLLCVIAATGLVAAGPAYARPPATGAITGRVTQAGHPGLPLGGVLVTANGNVTVASRTDAHGGYALEGLPASDYSVCFDGSRATGGTTDNTGYLDECYDNTRQYPPATVTVTVGATTTGVNAGLSVGGAVSGTITETGTGAPLANVLVSAFTYNEYSSLAHPTTTSADGHYSIRGLPHNNQYHLFVDGSKAIGGDNDAQGYSGFLASNLYPIKVVEGDLTSGQDAAVSPTGAVTGRVTDQEGHPLSNIYVFVFSKDYGEGARRTRTSPDGNFLLTGVSPSAGLGMQFSNDVGPYADKFVRSPAVAVGKTTVMPTVSLRLRPPVSRG